jgi:HPt (histidine-containing phosphotransfer) domain-containing protein
MPAKAVIDMEHLARYTGGDAKLNAEILHLFDAQAVGLVDQLRALLATRDAKSWREVTHTIKGAARGVGAFALADAAALCEEVGLTDLGAATAAVERLGTEAHAVQSFIREKIGT